MKTIKGMTFFKFSLAAFMASMLVWSCSHEDDVPAPLPTIVDTNSLVLKFTATANGMPLDMQTAFKDPLQRSMFVEQFKYYISNISLVQGEISKRVWNVALIIHENNGDVDLNKLSNKIFMNAPPGNYTGIRFGIGLDPALNATLPIYYPNNHPLSSKQSTYWDGWDTYRFIFIEGRADLNNDGTYNDLFGYHTGFDICYREVEYAKNFTVTKGGYTPLEFGIEINDIFFGQDTLDIAQESSWHGDTSTLDIGLRISDNFAKGIKIK